MRYQSSIEFEQALQQNDEDQLRKIFNQVASDNGYTSDEMNELVYVSAVYDSPREKLYELFLSLNPQLIHPAQISLAACRANVRDEDTATELARDYVRKFLTSSSALNLSKDSFLAHVLGRGFLLMTSIYTVIGARSYSLRILQKALELQISDSMRAHIQNEISTLNLELGMGNPGISPYDQKWEAFFTNGSHYEELARLCTNAGARRLARRLELLEGNFRFQAGFKVLPDEMFQQIVAVGGDENVSCLA
jgi:hypothetical protein